MYVPRGAYFLLEIDNIIHALGYGKHKKKSTQSFRHLVRKFDAFSNQNQRCLHVRQIGDSPRELTCCHLERDQQGFNDICATYHLFFFNHETDD